MQRWPLIGLVPFPFCLVPELATLPWLQKYASLQEARLMLSLIKDAATNVEITWKWKKS